MLYGPRDTLGPQVHVAVRNLTPRQRKLYDLLTADRTGNRLEARADALLIIENATRRGKLDEEFAYWTHPNDCRCMEI